MNPRTNYEMTEADLEKILEACKPTPVMFLSGGVPMGGSPQENANLAWAELGARMGFDSMTVRPEAGRGPRFFSAVPTETEQQSEERLRREKAEARRVEIEEIQKNIAILQARLAERKALLLEEGGGK